MILEYRGIDRWFLFNILNITLILKYNILTSTAPSDGRGWSPIIWAVAIESSPNIFLFFKEESLSTSSGKKGFSTKGFTSLLKLSWIWATLGPFYV